MFLESLASTMTFSNSSLNWSHSGSQKLAKEEAIGKHLSKSAFIYLFYQHSFIYFNLVKSHSSPRDM